MPTLRRVSAVSSFTSPNIVRISRRRSSTRLSNVGSLISLPRSKAAQGAKLSLVGTGPAACAPLYAAGRITATVPSIADGKGVVHDRAAADHQGDNPGRGATARP